MGQKTELIWGWHAVSAAANSGRCVELYLLSGRSDDRANELLRLCRKQGVRGQFVDRKQLDELTKRAVHQGCVAKVTPASAPKNESELFDLLGEQPENAVWLVLDEVTDPHNFGACVRSAMAAGVQAIVIPKRRSAPLSAVARTASAGLLDSAPLFQVANLSRVLKEAAQAGMQILGAAGEGDGQLHQLELARPTVWVMGSEDRGLRRLTREHCDQLVAIPMSPVVESLNVSVATALCLFESVRARELAS